MYIKKRVFLIMCVTREILAYWHNNGESCFISKTCAYADFMLIYANMLI